MPNWPPQREKAYRALGLPIFSSREEVDTAYKRLVQLHPDSGHGRARQLQEVVEAYDILRKLGAGHPWHSKRKH